MLVVDDKELEDWNDSDIRNNSLICKSVYTNMLCNTNQSDKIPLYCHPEEVRATLNSQLLDWPLPPL